QRVEADECDGREVGDRVVPERGIEIAVGRMRERGDVDGVAVGIGTGNEFGCNVAAGAGLVLDHDLLAPDLREAGRDDTGSRVDSAPRCERAYDAHQLRGPTFPRRPQRPRGRCNRNPGDEIASSHAVLPQPQTAPIAIRRIPHLPRRRIADKRSQEAGPGESGHPFAERSSVLSVHALALRPKAPLDIRPQFVSAIRRSLKSRPLFLPRSGKRKPSAGGSNLRRASSTQELWGALDYQNL